MTRIDRQLTATPKVSDVSLSVVEAPLRTRILKMEDHHEQYIQRPTS